MKILKKYLIDIIAVGIIFSCTACSGLDSFADNLKSGAEQLNKDVAIGKSNACIINELITKILEGNKRRINGEKVQSIKSITVSSEIPCLIL